MCFKLFYFQLNKHISYGKGNLNAIQSLQAIERMDNKIFKINLYNFEFSMNFKCLIIKFKI